MKKIVLLALGLSCYCIGLSQAGKPVDDFGTSGVAPLPDQGGQYFPDDIALQPDGKIVVLSSHVISDFRLARFTTEGNLDNTFGVDHDNVGGPDGYTTINLGSFDQAYDVAIQADGKLVIMGEVYTDSRTDIALARYNSNGTLDLSFGNSGTMLVGLSTKGQGASMSLLANGQLVVAAPLINETYAVVRLEGDGDRDPSFGTAGMATFSLGDASLPIKALAVHPDGKIVVAGEAAPAVLADEIPTGVDFMLARLLPDGSMDASFDDDGIVTADIMGVDNGIKSLAIDGSGNYVVAGYVYQGTETVGTLARFDSHGDLDDSFNGTGILIQNYIGAVTRVAVQSDGKIVSVGFDLTDGAYGIIVARYNPNGTTDASFGEGGMTVLGNGSGQPSLTLASNRIYVASTIGNTPTLQALQNVVTPLPLTLLAFTAIPENATIELQWQTVAEVNTLHFDVERSLDGKRFVKLAQLPAAVNYAAVRTYTYTDTRPAGAINHYRLKMVDQDGKTTYSKVLVVKTQAGAPTLTVFPNPASTHLLLKTTQAGNMHIRIYDGKGQQVREQTVVGYGSATPVQISVSGLAKGVYQVMIEGRGRRDVIAFVKS